MSKASFITQFHTKCEPQALDQGHYESEHEGFAYSGKSVWVYRLLNKALQERLADFPAPALANIHALISPDSARLWNRDDCWAQKTPDMYMEGRNAPMSLNQTISLSSAFTDRRLPAHADSHTESWLPRAAFLHAHLDLLSQTLTDRMRKCPKDVLLSLTRLSRKDGISVQGQEDSEKITLLFQDS